VRWPAWSGHSPTRVDLPGLLDLPSVRCSLVCVDGLCHGALARPHPAERRERRKHETRPPVLRGRASTRSLQHELLIFVLVDLPPDGANTDLVLQSCSWSRISDRIYEYRPAVVADYYV
jgi:hypothetical protein